MYTYITMHVYIGVLGLYKVSIHALAVSTDWTGAPSSTSSFKYRVQPTDAAYVPWSCDWTLEPKCLGATRHLRLLLPIHTFVGVSCVLAHTTYLVLSEARSPS